MTYVLFILHSTVSRCFSKDNGASVVIPRCFWDVACIALLLLNTSGGCDAALNFRKCDAVLDFFGYELKIKFWFSV